MSELLLDIDLSEFSQRGTRGSSISGAGGSSVPSDDTAQRSRTFSVRRFFDRGGEAKYEQQFKDRSEALQVSERIFSALEDVRKKVFEHLDPGQRPQRWVLAVPATWNDAGKFVLREAAARALFNENSNIQTVSGEVLHGAGKKTSMSVPL